MNPGEKALSGPADVGEPSVELPQIPRIVFHSRILPIVPTGVKHIPSFPNYVIVYRPETVPLQVVAVLHGQRDLKEVLS